ncbi:hypothetical protein CCYA_CCYA04G1210 [Cyanidiococcus yangmingshanensis]|nr:hypothetical protein CCYA_CCYA04G1210 [Cyanidiococcus yangmingshanensis]
MSLIEVQPRYPRAPSRYTPRTRAELVQIGRRLLDSRWAQYELHADKTLASAAGPSGEDDLGLVPGALALQTDDSLRDTIGVSPGRRSTRQSLSGASEREQTLMSIGDPGERSSPATRYSIMDTSSPRYEYPEHTTAEVVSTENGFEGRPQYRVDTVALRQLESIPARACAELDERVPDRSPCRARSMSAHKCCVKQVQDASCDPTESEPKIHMGGSIVAPAPSERNDWAGSAVSHHPAPFEHEYRLGPRISLDGRASECWRLKDDDAFVTRDSPGRSEERMVGIQAPADPACWAETTRFKDQLACCRSDSVPSLSDCSSEDSRRLASEQGQHGRSPSPIVPKQAIETDLDKIAEHTATPQAKIPGAHHDRYKDKLILLQQLQEQIGRIYEDLVQLFKSDASFREQILDQSDLLEKSPLWRLLSGHIRCLRELWHHESTQAAQLRALLGENQVANVVGSSVRQRAPASAQNECVSGSVSNTEFTSWLDERPQTPKRSCSSQPLNMECPRCPDAQPASGASPRCQRASCVKDPQKVSLIETGSLVASSVKIAGADDMKHRSSAEMNNLPRSSNVGRRGNAVNDAPIVGKRHDYRVHGAVEYESARPHVPKSWDLSARTMPANTASAPGRNRSGPRDETGGHGSSVPASVRRQALVKGRQRLRVAFHAICVALWLQSRCSAQQAREPIRCYRNACNVHFPTPAPHDCEAATKSTLKQRVFSNPITCNSAESEPRCRHCRQRPEPASSNTYPPRSPFSKRPPQEAKNNRPYQRAACVCRIALRRIIRRLLVLTENPAEQQGAQCSLVERTQRLGRDRRGDAAGRRPNMA